MSKIKSILLLVLVHAMMPAFGQNTPMTIQEWSNRQSQLKRAEMDSKLKEQLERSGGSTASALVEKTCDDDLSMFAVYGIGRNLRADFNYRGATITLAPGDQADMGGWFVQELIPTRAIMVKRKGKKIVSRCPLYLSGGIREIAPAVSGAALSFDTSVQVPPITAVQPGANGATKPASQQGIAK